jgi:hypothetical protein
MWDNVVLAQATAIAAIARYTAEPSDTNRVQYHTSAERYIYHFFTERLPDTINFQVNIDESSEGREPDRIVELKSLVNTHIVEINRQMIEESIRRLKDFGTTQELPTLVGPPPVQAHFAYSERASNIIYITQEIEDLMDFLDDVEETAATIRRSDRQSSRHALEYTIAYIEDVLSYAMFNEIRAKITFEDTNIELALLESYVNNREVEAMNSYLKRLRSCLEPCEDNTR